MDTQIRFLQELEDDLLEAAWRESLGREASGGRRPRQTRAPRRAPRRWVLVTSGAAASLVLSGAIGWFVMRGPETERPLTAFIGQPRPASGSPAPAFAPSAPGDSAYKGFRAAAGHNAPVTHGITTTGPLGSVGSVVGRPEDLSKVIKTAEISLVVRGGAFTDSFDRAQLLATRFGGYVVSASSQKAKSGHLVIRVNARRFDDAMVALRQIGRVERESIDAKDVTADFIDLHARLGILLARRTALVKLLSQATTLDTILRLQGMADDVQTNIDQLEGRLRYLKNQTSRATIRVDMREAGVVVTKPAAPVEKPSLIRAWQRSIAGFFDVLSAVTIGLGYVIPISVLVLAAFFAVRGARRRRAVA